MVLRVHGPAEPPRGVAREGLAAVVGLRGDDEDLPRREGAKALHAPRDVQALAPDQHYHRDVGHFGYSFQLT